MNRPFYPRLKKAAIGRSLAIAVAGLMCALAQAATGDGGLADPNITYVGRWDKSNGSVYTSHWDGAYFTTRFTGRNLWVKLAAGGGFRVVIDGGPAERVWGWTNATVQVATNLANDGPHTVQFVADYDTTEIPFQGLVLDAGATTLPVEPRPLIEFIGDSITAGAGGSLWAMTDYAWLTGEALGAHHTQIARKGITLADGYRYPETTWPGMEVMYFKTWVLPELCDSSTCSPDATHVGPNPPWDFSKYSAKIVVVNLGTNDWNLKVPGPTFQQKYTAFLANVRAKHPDAEIFALRTFNGYLVDETYAAVQARIAAGDSKVQYVSTDGWLTMYPSADFSDGFHPSDAGYRKVKDRLAPILQPYLTPTKVAVNDTQFTYDKATNWPSGSQSGAYLGDNRWSNVPSAWYQMPFSGTEVRLFGARAPWHGVAAVSIDDGPETMVDTYAASRADGVLLWSSPLLTAGAHTLKVRVTGQKNASSTGTYVVADRVDVVNGGLNLLANPGFETGLSGWTVQAAASSQSFVNNAGARSGTYQLVHGSASPYWAATYQTVTGLSNGLYTVRAWVRGGAGHELYVKNYGGPNQTAKSSQSTGYTELVIRNVNVTNGSAEIGFWSSDPTGNNWLNVDDVSFYKQ